GVPYLQFARCDASVTVVIGCDRRDLSWHRHELAGSVDQERQSDPDAAEQQDRRRAQVRWIGHYGGVHVVPFSCFGSLEVESRTRWSGLVAGWNGWQRLRGCDGGDSAVTGSDWLCRVDVCAAE